MSLNNFQLSPFLIHQLYKKTLVELAIINPFEMAEKNNSSSFLGKNEKQILILVDESETVFLSDTDLNLLVSILSACKLTLADVALVNFDKNKALVYEKLIEEFTPAFILLFGIGPSDLKFPLHFPPYQLQQYNHQTYLGSASLKMLAAEKEQKKELWTCLQKYFIKN